MKKESVRLSLHLLRLVQHILLMFAPSIIRKILRKMNLGSGSTQAHILKHLKFLLKKMVAKLLKSVVKEHQAAMSYIYVDSIVHTLITLISNVSFVSWQVKCLNK